MEENKATTENNKLSYEQLEQVALQLQQRAMQAEAKLGSINMTTLRLEYLFRVTDRANIFPSEFVAKCAAEIIELLEVKEETTKEDNNSKE